MGSKRIETVGIVAKRHKIEAAKIITELVAWLKERGVNVVIDEELKSLLDDNLRAAPKAELARIADLIAIFGGDGTLLSVARHMGDSDALVLGVNLGSLGFLTEITLDELYPAFQAVLEGRYAVDPRLMLYVELEREERTVATYHALNDAVINKGALARIIDMGVYIDGQFVSNFKADGLIISTPTGSTAYSLAAGGPIVYPSMEAFVITPICPHTLTNRPLVVSDKSLIEVIIKSGSDVMLTVDGQVGLPLQSRDLVKVRKGGNPLRLIQPLNKNYFQILRSKLKWGER